MRLCIHRGTKEIGGTCVELESQGQRIVLDVGLPLDCDDPDSVPLPPLKGFHKPDDSLLGVVISHPHPDHYGLANRLPEETPFLIGEAAQNILEAAADFTPAGLKLKNFIHLKNRQPITLGPFFITPYLVDHSAYDSYAILVEADGNRVFYSGDFRVHGRKASLVKRLINNPPKNVDLLLMEGTTLSRPDADHGFSTEDELVGRFVSLIESTEGLVLVSVSGQNIDRLVTIYKACQTAKRQLILDPYTLHIIHATGNDRIPREGWQDIRVFLPYSQKKRIMIDKNYELMKPFKPYRIFPEQLSNVAAKSVMIFRASMIGDLDLIEGLKIGRLIHSMWRGYLEDDRGQRLLNWLKQRDIPLDHSHTSGHAAVKDLRRLRHALTGSVVVPIHTTEAEQYDEIFGNARRVEDGEWFGMGLD